MRTRGFQYFFLFCTDTPCASAGFQASRPGLCRLLLHQPISSRPRFAARRLLFCQKMKKTRQTPSGQAGLRLVPFRNLPGSSLLHDLFHGAPSMAASALTIRSGKDPAGSTPDDRSSAPDRPLPCFTIPSTCRLPWRLRFDPGGLEGIRRVQD